MKLTPERFMVDESVIDRDYTYMKQMSPMPAKRLSRLIEDMCDRLEYEGSFMYDECPDKTTLLKMTDRIAEKMKANAASVMGDDIAGSMNFSMGGMHDMDSVSMKDFIQAMLCDEILYRRCRYYRKKKMFE